MTAGTRIPKSAAYLASRYLLRRLWGVGLVLTSAIVGLLGSLRLTRPVEKLSDATREIGKGWSLPILFHGLDLASSRTLYRHARNQRWCSSAGRATHS